MNEKLQYASMLEIPVNTCNITYKPIKKAKVTRKKKVSSEQVKEELMNKVNSAAIEEEKTPVKEQKAVESKAEQKAEEKTPQPKRKGKLSVVAVQIAVIGALIATIVITNLFNAESGLNAFFKGVFGGTQTVSVTDERVFTDFAPVIGMEGLNEERIDGVMSFSGSDSVYAPCDGEVKSVTQNENGLYDMEIIHSDNFISVFRGLTYAYVDVGTTVYGNIPVGYFKGELSMCFTSSDGNVIRDYQVIDDTVVWAV